MIVYVTKEIDGISVRLTTFVESVKGEVKADVDLASSLATEILAERLVNDPNCQASAFDFETAKHAAELIVEKRAWTWADLEVGGAIFPEELGDGLGDPDGDFEDITFPDKPDTDIHAAKAITQVIRNAGYSVAGTLETKLYEFAADFTGESGEYLGHLAESISLVMGFATLVLDHEPGVWTEVDYPFFDWVEDKDDTWIFKDKAGYTATILLNEDDTYSLIIEHEDEEDVLYTFEYEIECSCLDSINYEELLGTGTLRDGSSPTKSRLRSMIRGCTARSCTARSRFSIRGRGGRLPLRLLEWRDLCRRCGSRIHDNKFCGERSLSLV